MITLAQRFDWGKLIHLLATFGAGIWIPLQIDFVESNVWLDLGVDAFFLVLVGIPRLVEFRETGKIEGSRLSFLMDLLISFPLVSLVHLFGGPDPHFYLLLKLFSLRYLSDIRALMDSHDNLHPIVFRLAPLALTMPLVVHILACGWVYLGSGTAGPADDPFFEYWRGVYWSVTTLSTVGYGDISAKTVPQMLFASMTMFIGVGFFGYVLSNVASILARLDAAREEHLARLDKVEAFMRYNDLPLSLRTQVRAYYRYLWESRRGYDDSSVLTDLPVKLRAEVAYEINKEMIEKVPLFKGAERDLIHDIVLELKPQVFMPEERVFHVGEPGDGMYFIHKGHVEIVLGDGRVVATLPPGSFFGEMALITSNPRNATARSKDYCDLYVLKREAFEHALHRYPAFEEHIQKVAAERAGSSSGSSTPAPKAS